jgi:Bacterial Ig-like domain (group 2)/WD40-like Beta Propeller Repeat
MTDQPASVRGSWAVRGMLAALALSLLACSGDIEPTTGVPGTGPTVAISVSPRALSLVVGDAGTFSAQGADARNRVTGVSVAWSSADPSIATVRQLDGYVVAVAPGSTTVTATSGTLTATAVVSVRPPDPPVAVSISRAALSVIPGSVDRLVARAVDSTGRVVNVSFEWASADAAVATVGKTDGIVTAIAPGFTTVTATTGALSATATVSVIDFVGSFAFTRTSSSAGRFASDVLTYSSADGRLRSLPRSSEFASIAGLAWSPNGAQLAVEGVRAFFGPPEFEWLEYTSDLYVVDAETSGISPWRALTTNGMSRSPSWAPDGRRIAYVEQDVLFEKNHIALIDAAGGASVRLTPADGYYGRPLWSPDGTRVAFSAFVAGIDLSKIYIVDVDGSRSTRISPDATSDYDPGWSPDGLRLAFVRFREEPRGTYHFDVVVSDVDGRNVRRVATPAEFAVAPVWSPDGRQIMFATPAGLYAVNADGSGLTRITTPPDNAFDGVPTWR